MRTAARIALAGICTLAPLAQEPAPAPLLGEPAPAWGVTEWQQLPDDRQTLDAGDLRGKVVVLLCFQAACAASRERGLPALRALVERCAADDGIAFVAVQALLAEHDASTPAQARALAQRHALRMPIGHDGPVSRIARAYRIPRTPWIVVIDAGGIVRASCPVSEIGDVRALVETLRRPPGSINPLIGQSFGSTEALRAIGSRTAGADAELTLYRWWTDGCAHCETSMPDLSQLHRRYRERGLHFVAVYHPKRLRPPDDAALQALLEAAGFAGELSVDAQWRKLRELMRRAGLRAYTSVTFLVDREGIVRWVHPGPRLHRSDDPAYRDAATDFAALEQLIAARLRRHR